MCTGVYSTFWTNFDPKMLFKAPILLIFEKKSPWKTQFFQKIRLLLHYAKCLLENIHMPNMEKFMHYL